MAEARTCAVCDGPATVTTIPVRVEREGHEVLRLLVPALECGRCGHVAIEDEVTDAVVASLEENTRPGDDIILPGGATLH